MAQYVRDTPPQAFHGRRLCQLYFNGYYKSIRTSEWICWVQVYVDHCIAHYIVHVLVDL